MAKSTKKRVGIWLRVSTEDQAQGESPEHHERRARYYAESKDWEVVTVYHLEGVSGKSVIDHPETKRMLDDVKAGKITGLIFSKLARLARNTKQLLEFADLFREHEADLISLQESIDTSSPAGRLFYTMIAAMAQWEREEIADRVRASIPVRAKLGKPLSGSSPFGYVWRDKQMVVDQDEAPVRKLIYELFLEHRRLKTVARLLNERGARTRAGRPFSDTTVKRLIQDPTAKGTRRANYLTGTKRNGTKVEKPEEEWVWLPVEPIVSEEIWSQANAILDARKHGKAPGKRPRHVFAGYVHCGACDGRKMYCPSDRPQYRCHNSECRNKVMADDLDVVFQQQLSGYVFSPDSIAQHLATSDRVIQEKTELLESLETEAQKTQASIDKLTRLYLDDQVSADGFGRQGRPLEDRLKQLEDEIPRLQAELDLLKIDRLSSDQVVTEAQDLASRWPKLDDPEKRTIVESVVERILVGADEIEIALVYLPSVSKTAVQGQRSARVLSAPRRTLWSRAARSWPSRAPSARCAPWDATA